VVELRPITRRTALKHLGVAGAALVTPQLFGAPRAHALAEAAAMPNTIGAWSAPFAGPFPLVAIHATLLHNGKVLLVDKVGAYLWDPSGSAHQRIDPPNILYCSGHTVLGNGNVFFAGGVNQRGARGPRWTYEFDVAGSRWVRGPDLRRGRYYPTVCLLGDGRAVITSGKLEDGVTLNDDVEVYSNGTLRLVGTRLLRMYPHMWLLPDGKVLTGDVAGKSVVLNPATWSWGPTTNMKAKRVASAGVLMPNGPTGSTRVFVTGGHRSASQPPTATTESYDAANPGLGWQAQASLPQARSHMNLVLLPDGTMLGVSGTNASGAQRQALLYNPAANTWSGMASQTEERGYHSTALLLPDGRVLSAGDNFAPGGGSKLEIYSPPYLFKGARPVITAAPSRITWGANFAIDTSSAVARAVLVRPSSVTHTNDMNQRHVELRFSGRTGGITATAPPSSNVAPPGWYMLFLLDAGGVPSVARWLQIAS
jgi:hypothetical protein